MLKAPRATPSRGRLANSGRASAVAERLPLLRSRSVVDGVVKQRGKPIQVHSEPGQGTTFKRFIPAEAVSAVASPSFVAPRRSGPSGCWPSTMTNPCCDAGFSVLVAAAGDFAATRFMTWCHNQRCRAVRLQVKGTPAEFPLHRADRRGA